MTSRQPLDADEGLTHASRVMPVLRSSDGASVIVTRALAPLNIRAFPNFPVDAHVAPLMVPVLPLPDASATVPPVPSLKENAATSPPVVVGGGEVVEGGGVVEGGAVVPPDRHFT